MSAETRSTYENRVATVVGGRGALGSKVVSAMEPMGFRQVQVCEEGDPFTEFAKRSTDIFFAVPDTEILDMIQASRDYLTLEHTILDGSSVKQSLITTYRELDGMGISVASTHLGSVPNHPWRGVKVWVCEVGPHSGRAKRMAFDLFLPTNSWLIATNIEDHVNVEIDQWFTMATSHIFASALRNMNYGLGDFDTFATLSAEIQALLVGRILGQGTKVPSEVLFYQPKREHFLATIKQGLLELEEALGDRDALEAWMERNIDFHNADGAVDALFKKAGVVGARNANLRMQKISFRIVDDRPGVLARILGVFSGMDANLTAIDSMSGSITKSEVIEGVDPDGIVDFNIGFDPETITPEYLDLLKQALRSIGCRNLE